MYLPIWQVAGRTVVYFIQSWRDGHVKIGTTGHLPSRVNQIAADERIGEWRTPGATRTLVTLLAAFEGGTYREAREHARFADSWVGREGGHAGTEWFEWSDEMRDYLERRAGESLCSPHHIVLVRRRHRHVPVNLLQPYAARQLRSVRNDAAFRTERQVPQPA
jgi:hypothetical protein